MKNVKIDREWIKSYINSVRESVPEVQDDCGSIMDQGVQIYFDEAEPVSGMSDEEVGALLSNLEWLKKFYGAWFEIWAEVGGDMELAKKYLNDRLRFYAPRPVCDNISKNL